MSRELDDLREERDELAIRAADLEQVREELRQKRLLVEGYHADYQEWSGEKQQLVDRSLSLKAELASARQELELLRRPTTNTSAFVVADLVVQHERYLCETCSARYAIAYTDHPCGPLTPVTVTITRQAEGPTE